MVYFCCVVRSLCRLVWKMWLDGTNRTGLDNFNLLADGTLTLFLPFWDKIQHHKIFKRFWHWISQVDDRSDKKGKNITLIDWRCPSIAIPNEMHAFNSPNLVIVVQNPTLIQWILAARLFVHFTKHFWFGWISFCTKCFTNTSSKICCGLVPRYHSLNTIMSSGILGKCT